jgi:predicted membrane protein
LAVSLAIAFEIGAAASLASLIALDKMNKTMVWFLFVLLTAMQAMGNTYYAYTHLDNFNSWIELFGLVDEELIYQKRILSIISGAILPLVALGFIKSLVDYIKPDESAGIVQEEEINIDDINGGERGDTAEEKEVKTGEDIKEEILNNQETQTDPSQKSRNTFIYEDPTRLK